MISMILMFLEIHEVRPHTGQKLVASRIRSLLHSEVFRSEIAGNKDPRIDTWK